MSLDLYERETGERLSRLQPVQRPETGAFDGFARGTGLATMKGFAKTARAIDLAGAVGPIVQDAFTGGTTAQDKYFREHDELFGRAVDYWTPTPGEVGVAGEVAGSLLSTLPLVIASPGLAVATTQLAAGEDLTQKGVSPQLAGAVGAVQGAGLGTGIWMPILGRNLWQRVVIGGAGYNVLQGAATRGLSGALLEGTPAAEEFKAFDGTALTLDALLGMAFGGLAHVSPAARAQGKEAWERIGQWARERSPSEIDALATLRQAQHLNLDSTPGKPLENVDIEAHVNRVRAAIDQLATDQPVNVRDLPQARVEPDPARERAQQAQAAHLVREGERVMRDEGIPETAAPPEPSARTSPPGQEAEAGPAARHPTATTAPSVHADANLQAAATRQAEIEASALPVERKAQLSGMFARAAEAKPDFDGKLAAIAEVVGAKPILPGLKGVPRTIDKIRADYAGDPARMKDILRGTLEVSDLGSAESIIAGIARNFEVLPQASRNLLDPAAKPIDGYRDAKFNVRLENGTVAEVQVNVPEMLAAKKKAHGLYEERSTLERKIVDEGRRATDEEEATIDRLNAGMRAIYEPVWAGVLSKPRNTSLDIGAPLRRADSGSNLRGGSVSQAAQYGAESQLPRDTGMPSTLKNSALGENVRPNESIGTSERSIAREGEVTPLSAAAERFVSENPDVIVTLGRDADGTPITVSARQFLEEARAEVARAQEDASLFEVAASCMLGAT